MFPQRKLFFIKENSLFYIQEYGNMQRASTGSRALIRLASVVI